MRLEDDFDFPMNNEDQRLYTKLVETEDEVDARVCPKNYPLDCALRIENHTNFFNLADALLKGQSLDEVFPFAEMASSCTECKIMVKEMQLYCEAGERVAPPTPSTFQLIRRKPIT